jgi:hypothetical protein
MSRGDVNLSESFRCLSGFGQPRMGNSLRTENEMTTLAHHSIAKNQMEKRKKRIKSMLYFVQPEKKHMR